MDSIKTQGIVLQTIKYGDHHLISHIFTESHGRLSFFMRGSSKKKNTYRNLLFPLSILKIDFFFSEKKTLQYFKEIGFTENPVDFFSNVEKLPVVFLLAELFEKTIKPNDRNPETFEFIYRTILNLQRKNLIQNSWFVHVLVTYLHLLGIAPDLAFGTRFFDLESGHFTNNKPTSSAFLNNEETHFFLQLLNNRNFDESFVIPKEKRLIMIEKILRFYQIHLGVGEIKSFKILKNLYN